MSNTVRLFVYGSLKGGRKHHNQLGSATFLRNAKTAAKYSLVNLGAYPALTDGFEVVTGELYEVESEELARLDAFEGPEYRRAEVALEDETVAFSYFLRQGGDFPPITGGSW